ncbi:PIN domain-containing protein [Candidatus Woesearchaeota archaeon]|nr:PIN domain-containing protein [Candidatus Woesearchaeota archaeon]
MPLFLDTSVWLAYIHEQNEHARRIIDSAEQCFASTLTLFEVKRKLLRDGVKREKLDRTLSFIRSRAIIIDVTKSLAEAGAEISARYDLSTVDAILLASAHEAKARLVSGDRDFSRFPNIDILK